MRKQIVFAGTIILALAACAPKDNSGSAKTDSSSASVSPSTGSMSATAAATAPAPNVITVHATDFAYSAPTTIPAGMTTFHLVNDGKAPHHLTLIRIDSGKTVADLEHELAMPAAPPTWVRMLGGPNAVGPGQDDNATLDLTPGSYAMVCFIPIPGNVPHFAKGMIHAFTVTAAPTGAAAVAPTPDETIQLHDYTFDLSTPLTAGKHTIEVTNTGSQAHEVVLMKLAPGKTIQSVLDWMDKPTGPPPAEYLGGVAAMDSGFVNYFSVDLTPGNYGLVCFLSDAKDGKPHFAHGMMKTLTVM